MSFTEQQPHTNEEKERVETPIVEENTLLKANKAYLFEEALDMYDWQKAEGVFNEKDQPLYDDLVKTLKEKFEKEHIRVIQTKEDAKKFRDTSPLFNEPRK